MFCAKPQEASHKLLLFLWCSVGPSVKNFLWFWDMQGSPCWACHLKALDVVAWVAPVLALCPQVHMFCVIWQVTLNILLSWFFLPASQSRQQNSIPWQTLFPFQGKWMGPWVHMGTPPFLAGSLTPGNTKLPPKQSSGFSVCETLVEHSTDGNVRAVRGQLGD